MKRTFFLTMGVAAVMALVVPGASASFVLTLDDTAIGAPGSLEVIVSDGALAGFVTASGLVTTVADADGLVNGTMTYTGPAGVGSTFTVNVTSGVSTAIIGPPAQLNLFSADVSTLGAGTLIVGLTDTGFAPAILGPWGLLSEFGGTALTSISSIWYADEFNGEFVSGTAAGAFGPLGGAFSASGVAAALIPLPGPFSLSTEVTLVHGGSGITSFSSEVRNTVPANGGGEGCTPGFWKQSQHFGSWPAPYVPGTLFSAVFEDAFPGLTLIDVMLPGGGNNPLRQLGRHTVAALLNAASPAVDYDLTVAEVIALFNDVFPGTNQEYNTLQNSFNDFNELGCPLDGEPSPPSGCVDVNGICDSGEDCENCPSDCDSKTNGRPSGRYCCGNGVQEGPEGDGRCQGNF